MKKISLFLIFIIILSVTGCKKPVIPVKNNTSGNEPAIQYKDGTYKEKSGYDSQNCWYQLTVTVKDSKIQTALLEGFYNVLNGIYTAKTDKDENNTWYELTLTYDAGVFKNALFIGKYTNADGKEALMDVNYLKDKPEEYEKGQSLIKAISDYQTELMANNGDIALIKESENSKDTYKALKELYNKAILLANDDAASKSPIKMDQNFGVNITDPTTRENAQKAVDGISIYGPELVKKGQADKVDSISGATLAYKVFKELAEKCLNDAKK